ncbi:endo alpha-1,4 polygalactosaminidase [Kitasatospora sp. NPDC059571]|uniref:endo alpha-1,4 polygalactosaminidase n=1 Tax=Kitasatospora sp. NPDC059571 TaxID=3346871 RepID=UPI0036866632
MSRSTDRRSGGRRSARTAFAALAAAGLLFAAGCSSSDGDGGDAADDPTAAPPSAGTPGPSASGSAGSPSPDGSPDPSGTAGPSGTGKPSGRSGGGAVWHPPAGVAWQWQLGGKVDQSVDVPVYDIDGFENDAGVVSALHAKGRKVICYINVGAWESFRSDAGAFPESVRGSGDGWDGERWLDIRQLDKLRTLMGARFDMCRDKGFDAVEPDLVEGYANKTGFPLTADDQLRFNRMIADLAHERGLGVGLKNDLAQIPALVDVFDFSVDEQCAEFDECAALTPFIKQNKAVLHVEYNVQPADFCGRARSLGLSSMAKHKELDAWRKPC